MSDLSLKKEFFSDGNDSVIITHDLADLPGGCTLDCSGLPEGTEVVPAGSVIALSQNGKYVPIPIVDGELGSAEGNFPVGILKRSVPVSDPRAAVLTMGQVNYKALPYVISPEDMQGLLSALNINFINYGN